MKYRMLTLILALMMVVPTVLFAGDEKKDVAKSDEAETITDATVVIKEFAGMKEGPPRGLVEKAEAIIIVPGLVKASFVVGGEHGDGVLLARDANGNWGQPLFVDVTGGSIGWQAGVSSTDLILILMRDANVKEILDGEFKVGGEAGVALGPLGREGSAGTDVHFDEPIYSYSRSKGVFAGVSVEGTKISLDGDSNVVLYGATPNAHEVIMKPAAAGTASAELASALRQLTGEKKPETGAKTSGSK
jgi:lipid-binding SYLF domain-containing protein